MKAKNNKENSKYVLVFFLSYPRLFSHSNSTFTLSHQLFHHSDRLPLSVHVYASRSTAEFVLALTGMLMVRRLPRLSGSLSILLK